MGMFNDISNGKNKVKYPWSGPRNKIRMVKLVKIFKLNKDKKYPTQIYFFR